MTIPEKVEESSNRNEGEENAVRVKKVFVLNHEEYDSVEDHWIQALAEEKLQAVIKCKKIPLSTSTYGREFSIRTLKL